MDMIATQNGSVPLKFLFYYVSCNYSMWHTDELTSESLQYQRQILDFKDGKEQHCMLEPMADCLLSTWGEQFLHKVALVFIPASTEDKNNKRWRHFSSEICARLGCVNGFEHIKVYQEKECKHISGQYVEPEQYCLFDDGFFRGRNVILIDDVITRGHTFSAFANFMIDKGAKIIGCVALGKTYRPSEDERNPCHPVTGNAIRNSGHQVINLPSRANLPQNEEDDSNKNERAVPPLLEPALTKAASTPEQTEVKLQDNPRFNPGDIFTFGQALGKPLEWLVLKVESSCVTLISLYATADRLYHDQDEDTSWENCSLRRWLNQTFLQSTFSPDEIELIVPSHVPFADNDEYESIQEDSFAAETVDQVFILSAGEYRSYFGQDRLTWSCRNMRGLERQCWLRNSGSDLRKCAFLGMEGKIYWSGSIVNNVRHAVRPVIVVRI